MSHRHPGSTMETQISFTKSFEKIGSLKGAHAFQKLQLVLQRSLERFSFVNVEVTGVVEHV